LIEIVNHKDKLEVCIKLKIKTEQRTEEKIEIISGQLPVSVSPPPIIKEANANNFNSPAVLSIDIRAGSEGKLDIFYSAAPGKMQEGKLLGYDNFDESLRLSFNILHNSLENIANSIQKALEENLKKNFGAKVILPLGNVYTFKNIRLYEEVNKCDAQDNAVVCDITYAPKYSPVAEK
jgi:hypothetical protein